MALNGKLTLTTGFGGDLEDYMGRDALAELVGYVDQAFVSFGAEPRCYGAEGYFAREGVRTGAFAECLTVPLLSKNSFIPKLEDCR